MQVDNLNLLYSSFLFYIPCCKKVFIFWRYPFAGKTLVFLHLSKVFPANGYLQQMDTFCSESEKWPFWALSGLFLKKPANFARYGQQSCNDPVFSQCRMRRQKTKRYPFADFLKTPANCPPIRTALLVGSRKFTNDKIDFSWNEILYQIFLGLDLWPTHSDSWPNHECKWLAHFGENKKVRNCRGGTKWGKYKLQGYRCTCRKLHKFMQPVSFRSSTCEVTCRLVWRFDEFLLVVLFECHTRSPICQWIGVTLEDYIGKQLSRAMQATFTFFWNTESKSRKYAKYTTFFQSFFSRRSFTPSLLHPFLRKQLFLVANHR